MPLSLVQRPGSPYWYIRGRVRGLRVFESTGLGERAQAEEALIQRAAQLVQQSIHGHSAVRTFADAALSYMEAGGERTHLTPLIRHFGRAKLVTLGQSEIEDAARKLKPGASPATINRQIFTPAAAVLNHAARKKWCDRPVLTRPEQPEGRVRWITPAEAEQLIAHAAPHLQPLAIFLLATGARVSEALYLDWRDVDLTAGQVSFLNVGAGGVGVKNGESRGVPLHPRAVAALANLPHRTGKVFRVHFGGVNWKGKVKPVGPAYALRISKKTGQVSGGGQIKTAWSAMLRRAGIADFTPHDCRHTWATWHYRANRDLTALMALGGWKSIEMVLRYAHVNTDHLAAGVGKMWSAPAAVGGGARGEKSA